MILDRTGVRARFALRNTDGRLETLNEAIRATKMPGVDRAYLCGLIREIRDVISKALQRDADMNLPTSHR